MHELSVAEGIIGIVEKTATQHQLKSVKEVRIALGELVGVDPDALAFAWESVTRSGVARGAKLVIDRKEGTAWCMMCSKTVPLKAYGNPCPQCGSYELIANGGTEMKVIDLVPGDD